MVVSYPVIAFIRSIASGSLVISTAVSPIQSFIPTFWNDYGHD
jgi:hypothetical protein